MSAYPKDFKTHTRIRVEVEVPGSVYGPEWNVGSMAKQASEEIPVKLANHLQKIGARIVGTPKVVFITAEEE